MPPCAPHLMFHRPDLAPPPAAAGMYKEGEERRLKLSDLEWVADLGEGASGVVTKVHLRGTAGPAFALKVAHYPDDTDAVREQDEVLIQLGFLCLSTSLKGFNFINAHQHFILIFPVNDYGP